MRIFIPSLLRNLLFVLLLMFVFSCNDAEKNEIVIEPPTTYALSITDVKNIPENVKISSIEVKLTGACWSEIDTIKALFDNGVADIVLPTVFSSDDLQNVDRHDKNMCGYWPATSNDPDALVATMGDIIAFQDDKKVGRIYLSNWSGKGSSAGKAFVYYQYTDRNFELTGRNASYYYSNCSFKKGWNAYANINPTSEETAGNIRCTTSIPNDLTWCFESWVH